MSSGEEPDPKHPKTEGELSSESSPGVAHPKPILVDQLRERFTVWKETLLALRSIGFAGALNAGYIDEANMGAFIEANRTSPEAQELASGFFTAQEEVIRFFFDFLKDAAKLFKIDPGCLTDAGSDIRKDIFNMAMTFAYSPLVDLVPSDLEKFKRGKSFYLCLRKESKNEKDTADALADYTAAGARIRANEDAAKFVDRLCGIFDESREKLAFTALCLPSGAGKTQLAFSLPEDVLVMYMNTNLRSTDPAEKEVKQSIYENFRGYAWFVWKKLQEDWEAVKNAQEEKDLWLYGIVVGFMELIQEEHLAKNPIKFPEDLARFVITTDQKPLDGFVRKVQIKPASRDSAEGEIERAASALKKRVVFFLDEFAANDTDKLEHFPLALLRRSLRNLRVCVVVASTNSGAVNMLHKNAAAEDSRTGMKPWVFVCTQLPKYVPTKELLDAMAAVQDANLKTLMEYSTLHSRPFFAATVASRLLVAAKADAAPAAPNAGKKVEMKDLVEELRTLLVGSMRRKADVLNVEGCFGYIVALLTAGFTSLVAGDDKLAKMLGQLTTKNWAYLVNEVELRKSIDSDKSDLQSTTAPGTLNEVTEACKKEISMILYRQDAAVDVRDKLHYFLDNKPQIFQCATYFPVPKEDFLLHLVLAGCISSPGLRVWNREGTAVLRISTSLLIKNVMHSNKPEISSSKMPNWKRIEWRVCAAFMVASNSGSIFGCTLEVLLRRFVEELLEDEIDRKTFVELAECEKIHWSGKFEGKFVWPVGTHLPLDVHEIFGSRETTRPNNGQKLDFGSLVPSSTLGSGRTVALDCSVKVISTTENHQSRGMIEAALERQDADARVSFIVVEKSVAYLKEDAFSLRNYEALTRVDPTSNKLPLPHGDSLARGRLLNVTVQGRRIVLEPLDGKGPLAKTETDSDFIERLIFVISLSDINSQVASPFASSRVAPPAAL